MVLTLLLIAGGGIFSLSAQNRVVTGQVMDAKQQPLMGVAVLIEGTTKGTTTTETGDFSIEAENISNETFTDDGDLYFFADSYSDSSGYTYGDYYVYRNGEATRLVRDALCSTGAVSVTTAVSTSPASPMAGSTSTAP